MPTPEKTVRVFISSTFRYMHAERDHLVTVVFPKLRERVEQLGLEFFDVDLRWGVPAKDANGETANPWEYCRQWIDRVEPFFVCILGQRYGWVPEPEQLKKHFNSGVRSNGRVLSENNPDRRQNLQTAPAVFSASCLRCWLCAKRRVSPSVLQENPSVQTVDRCQTHPLRAASWLSRSLRLRSVACWCCKCRNYRRCQF
jgi:hypothetical protein